LIEHVGISQALSF